MDVSDIWNGIEMNASTKQVHARPSSLPTQAMHTIFSFLILVLVINNTLLIILSLCFKNI